MAQIFCPHCETTRQVQSTTATEHVVVRGEAIPVTREHRACQACGASFDQPGAPDTAALAHEAYRRKAGLLSPDEIRAFRTAHDLTQHELGRLLGWGGATVSRYENGALQDDAHDRALRLLMRAGNLPALIERYPEALAADKCRAILARLHEATAPGPGLLADLEALLITPEPDETSGFRRFSLTKFFGATLFLCRDEAVSRPDLNGLLWRADFTHYREHKTSITGARYLRGPWGPVADRHHLLFAYLLECTSQLVEGPAPETLRAAAPPDLAMFTDPELQSLLAAKASAAPPQDDRAYRETAPGQPISYRYAQYLQQP
jgi:putative zinc finger/helix-turn-helix YgiT family protein